MGNKKALSWMLRASESGGCIIGDLSSHAPPP
jgi:hypothetical protein